MHLSRKHLDDKSLLLGNWQHTKQNRSTRVACKQPPNRSNTSWVCHKILACPGIIKQTGSKASFFLARMSPWNSFHAKRLSCQKTTHPNLILHFLLQTVGRLEDSSRPVELNSDMARHIEILDPDTGGTGKLQTVRTEVTWGPGLRDESFGRELGMKTQWGCRCCRICCRWRHANGVPGGDLTTSKLLEWTSQPGGGGGSWPS